MALPKIDYNNRNWNQAKEKIREILIRRARSDDPITYTELAREAGLVLDGDVLGAADVRLWSMLCDISREEDAAGRGMLSVLVVESSGDRMPGNHFFTLARQLRRKIGSRDKFWIVEFNQVCSYWRNH